MVHWELWKRKILFVEKIEIITIICEEKAQICEMWAACLEENFSTYWKCFAFWWSFLCVRVKKKRQHDLDLEKYFVIFNKLSWKERKKEEIPRVCSKITKFIHKRRPLIYPEEKIGEESRVNSLRWTIFDNLIASFCFRIFQIMFASFFVFFKNSFASFKLISLLFLYFFTIVSSPCMKLTFFLKVCRRYG